MKKWMVILIVAMLATVNAFATVSNYSGDVEGFEAAISGFEGEVIDFDDLTLGEIIYDQYNPPVKFLAKEGQNITANDNAWGTSVRSAPLCAQVPKDLPGVDYCDLEFAQSVFGVSLWVLDVSSLHAGIDVTVFGENDVILDSFRVGPGEGLPPGVLHTHVAVLSDVKEITRVRVQNVYEYDGFGLDDITVVSEAAPIEIEWVYIDNDPGVEGHEGFTGYMSKYETTNAQYCEFLNAALASEDINVGFDNIVYGANGSNGGEDFVGQVYYNLDGPGCTEFDAINGGAARINYSGGVFSVDSGFENHPVTFVSWYGAMAFADYYGYRLPTEWEWQAVADFDGSFIYGCGTDINNIIANYRGSIHPDGTNVVGSFGTYGYGMCDMAGNIWDWTYNSDYINSDCVLRGGSWDGHPTDCTVSRRIFHFPILMHVNVGFRVVRDVEVSCEEGGIVSWGSDTHKQVSDTPCDKDFVAIEGGGYHGLALKADGSLVAWGMNDHNEVSDTPTGNDFVAIACTHVHALALKTDGTVVTWGDNSHEQLDIPVEAQSGVVAIAAGGYHSLVLKADGSVIAWGNNQNDQCDVPPEAQSGVVAIAAGGFHSLALKNDGSIVSWGHDKHGAVSQTPPENENDFIAISGGGWHSLALRNDGSVVAWGMNDHNEVSDTPSGNDYAAIDAGGYHNLALKTDGSVIAWGSNVDLWGDYGGQIEVPERNDITAISAGNFFSMALVCGEVCGNTEPVADAGGPYVEEATSWDGAMVTLDGTGSYDPDGDALTYEWYFNLVVDPNAEPNNDSNTPNGPDATGATPEVLFPIGQTEISLIVVDECGARSEPNVTYVTVDVINVDVEIRIDDGNDTINVDSDGVVRVAFLTDLPEFDANTIDPNTVVLEGMDFTDGLVKLRSKNDTALMVVDQDYDGDGDIDRVVNLDTERLTAEGLDAYCEIAALTYDGYVVLGVDIAHLAPVSENPE